MNTHQYKPTLSFYHANGKGTGSAARFALVPATAEIEGYISLEIAHQGPIHFDWDNAIKVQLGFGDLCSMLQVFRGEVESIWDGNGLYHRGAKTKTIIRLSHRIEPVYGYLLEVDSKVIQTQDESKAHILFSPAEALGLCEAISGSMSVIAFGLPTIVPVEIG